MFRTADHRAGRRQMQRLLDFFAPDGQVSPADPGFTQRVLRAIVPLAQQRPSGRRRLMSRHWPGVAAFGLMHRRVREFHLDPDLQITQRRLSQWLPRAQILVHRCRSAS